MPKDNISHNKQIRNKCDKNYENCRYEGFDRLI